MNLRPAIAADMAAVTALYAPFVQTSTITFELEPPSIEEMTRRWQALVTAGYPYWVAVDGVGMLLGYAYCGPFRSRLAYKHCAENSVYVVPGNRRAGLGRILMETIIAQATAQGINQMLAVITDTHDTLASLAFHEAIGFKRVGTLEKVGFKFERWLDVALLQRSLD